MASRGIGIGRMLAAGRSLLGRGLIRAGWSIIDTSAAQKSNPWVQLPFDVETLALWNQVRSRTMTSIERVDALRFAVEYVHENSIPGAIVECGVWRGGSMMAVALTLRRLGGRRKLWLYDTYCGMTAPGTEDVDFQGRAAVELISGDSPQAVLIRAESSLEEVQGAMAQTGYPMEEITFVVGPVEKTIPRQVPETIALLRLDTDWFESTRHELVYLWPRLSQGGVLIIDDYGDWAGAKRAVDEYFASLSLRPLLQRIDATGRLTIKTAVASRT
jgi:O-methyltransferase